MMRPATLMAALCALAACDDPQQIDRAPSDLYVHVYVERDGSVGMGENDTPLRASVTVIGQEDDFEAADTTGPEGIATFLEVPGGAYTVSHAPTDLPFGLERVGSHRQTVIAPAAGDSVVTRFVYRDTVVSAAPAGARY